MSNWDTLEWYMEAIKPINELHDKSRSEVIARFDAKVLAARNERDRELEAIGLRTNEALAPIIQERNARMRVVTSDLAASRRESLWVVDRSLVRKPGK